MNFSEKTDFFFKWTQKASVKKQTIIFIVILVVYFLFFMEYVAAFAYWPVKGLLNRIFFNLFLDFVVLHQKPALTVTCVRSIWPDMWSKPLAHSRPGWQKPILVGRFMQLTTHLPQVQIPVYLRRRGGYSRWGRGEEWPCVHCPFWAWTDPRSPLWILGCTASLMGSLLVFWTM